ncbi:LysR family transcriptional regulator [Pseudomonas protegens]|uniref:LysR family transcriptional regulator n=1 Tax=Pseudomonas TaxID=286 RepID=UPI00090833E7|nr:MULTISPECIES: LysR family transcriptional regulator [Pseudomonas]APC20942.1 LysR family transcriptional regulator [Pseudomonas protegens]MBP5096596.1 LysR family transcriptional regulator [Pseudomonas protegens]MCS4259914.1 DNA-binding transcriptional LysR family regulator [Pseudomonas sp. BIGb0176]MDF4205325.1 LysR family transcriptional regulator [Pseudomonas protegens]MDT9646203.1 LysR family transcriptional regulator [Pseudomonas sp. JV245A]
MSTPDLNLLLTLDVLLAEGSVARAAQRLHLSPSAMSRALARLRQATGDPLLVRAGRGLVPTPRALELRQRIGQLVADAQAALRPAEQIDLGRLQRTFTLRSRDGFVENFGPALVSRLRAEAPGVRVHFVPKLDRDSQPLRDASVDLETAVIDADTSPELRTRALFRDRFIGVVRAGHPLSRGPVSLDAYVAGEHILAAHQGHAHGRMDEALKALCLERQIVTLVSGFSAALALARGSDLIAMVPERHTSNLRHGLHGFSLPVPLPEMTISLLWHPRMEADPAHRWLRQVVHELCSQSALPDHQPG